MIYKGVVARFNGVPDSQGDVLSDNVQLPANPVRITHEFHSKTNIGMAHLVLEQDRITAYVDLSDQDLFTQEMVSKLYIVPGGIILERDGTLVKKWSLSDLALTSSPSDKTLTPLEPSRRNGCCEYSGPPFKKCFKCGGRQSF